MALTLLPRSLVGRVFALYSGTLAAFVAMGLALFLHYQFNTEVEAAVDDAQTLFNVLVPVVTDSAVIGDYDTIKRQIDRAAKHSSISGIRFTDMQGAKVGSGLARSSGSPPAWLSGLVAGRLHDSVAPISAGGTQYGTLTLGFSADQIADELWRVILFALALGATSLVGGLLLIHRPLVRWLGHLDRIGELGLSLDGGKLLARQALAGDAPIEFQKTFEVLDRAATSLHAQREQAQATLEAIDDAVLTCALDGRVTLANPAAVRLLGRELPMIVGQPVTALLPALAAVVSAAPDPGDRWQHRELRWTPSGGSERVFDSNRFPVIDGDGQVVNHVLALRDVTEQHRLDQHLKTVNATRDAAVAQLRDALERSPVVAGAVASGNDDLEVVSQLVSRLVQRLQERNEQLDAIFGLSPDGFVSFDAERTVRYASPGFCRMSGLSPDMVVGLDEDVLLFRLLSRSKRKLPTTTMAMLREGVGLGDAEGGIHQIEFDRPQRRVIAIALHQGQSGIVSQVLHLRDVTHETEVDRMKSEFLTTAAHELRTPMASIFGFVELLMNREVAPAKQKQMLEVVYRQSQVMIELVNELLDLARIEARRDIDFVLREADLLGVVQGVVEGFHVPAGRPAPTVEPPAHEMPVRIDFGKMQQALRNVLSNAYKYSPEGGQVVIRFVRSADLGPGSRIGIEVEDHGIGMTPEQLQRVGERFYRADASGNIPGTGLGMRLVREMLGLMGGSVDLRSAPGQGSTVTLWLPLLTEVVVPADVSL